MQVVASQPSSIVEVSLEPGDELVASMKRALADAGFTEAFVMGSGEVEDAEVLTLLSSTGKRHHRKLAGPADLVTLSGTFGETGLELRATVASESESGAVTVGGLLVRATVVSVQARALVRSAAIEPKAAMAPRAAPAPAAAPALQPEVAAIPVEVPRPLITPPPAVAPPAKESSPQLREPDPPRAPPPPGPPLPPKLRRADTIEVYPEEGDVITHFAFGRCVVVFSDGERLRLQQDRDGRVREVAMSMLRIEPPTILEDGRRHWELARKN